MNAAAKTKELTPSQRAELLTCGLVALSLLVYWFGVRTTQAAVQSTKKEVAAMETRQATVRDDLRESHVARERRAELEKAREPYLGALLTPLLGSWSMRAKAVLDPLAADIGVQISDYTELPARALPLPKPTPLQLYARQPIRIACQGTYGEIASFVMRVEKLLPYVSLQALSIKTQKDPMLQSATIVFEWPVKGALSRTVDPKKGGAK